jgi:acetyl esterase
MVGVSLGAAIQRSVARGLLGLPAPVLRLVTRRERTLDPQVAMLIALNDRIGGMPNRELGVKRARRRFEASVPLVDAPMRRHIRKENRYAGTIPIRIYRPLDLVTPTPAILYLHGGGFTVGSLNSHDRLCRVLADETQFIVVAVDYRLAPEYKAPAAADDAIAAFDWLSREGKALGIDPARIAVCGDSAGGNLSAQVALARKPALQVLVYPMTDATSSMESHRSNGKGFLLDQDGINWFHEQYLVDEAQARDPRVSPLYASDVSGVAPAIVVVAGFDPLRDEGIAYANKLRQAGVRVDLRCENSMIHGFWSMTGVVAAARRAVRDVAGAIRRELTQRS